MPISYNQSQLEDVKELYAEDGWKINALESNFNEDICNHICNTLGSFTSTEGRDKAWWMPSSDGKFKVSSAWELCKSREEYIEDISKIWEKGLPFKVSLFMWRLWFRRIPIG
ncbi:hypothetical protein R3W88_029626 [Solanum pinnatisectum]|uniref:Reverse transcriptase zinc-binding domain-containing protein n=1 Tax=Solanum pinnatisectum TaxID=50273 RepID=A0AAV9K5W8_9SOLN|nr:hypothetical protein R3W88_029626 [Solanum pinnatisectum]